MTRTVYHGLVAGLVAVLLVNIVQSYDSSRKVHKEKRADYGPNDFDYYTLALTWIPSKVLDPKSASYSAIPKTAYPVWGLHGLWPSRWVGFGPEQCKPAGKFDMKTLAPLLTKMRGYWPNIFKNSRESNFWSHEWFKHGTCCLNQKKLNNAFKYFNQTMYIANRLYDLKTLFGKVGVKPSDVKGYKKDLFLKPLASKGFNATNSQIIYFCTTKCYINEIRLCLDKKTMKPGKCGRKYPFRAKKALYYPKYPPANKMPKG